MLSAKVVAFGLAGFSFFCGYCREHCFVPAGGWFYQGYQERDAFGCHKPAADVFTADCVREVGAGELAEELFCPVVIGFGGEDLAFEEAEVLIFFVLRDYGTPFFELWVEIDALIRRKPSAASPAVCHVLRARADAEVCPSIVESVVVFVVYFEAGRGLDDLPVHLDCCSSFFDFDVSYGVKGVRPIAAFLGAPFEL